MSAPSPPSGAAFEEDLRLDSRILWTEKQSLPEARAGSASRVFGQDLLVAGGTNWNGDSKRWLDRVDLYHFESGRWRSGPPLPRAFAFGCSTVTEAGFEIIGGCDGSSGYRDSWLLPPGASTWRGLDEAPENFVFAAAERWSGDLYVFGGCASDHDLTAPSNTVWIRDTGHTWRQISALPQRDVVLSAHACVGGKVYLFGGSSVFSGGQVQNHNGVFSFDCKTHAWTRLRNLPAAVRGASAVALDNGSIMILGGYGTDFLKTVLIYHPEDDRYEEATPLPIGLFVAQFVVHQALIYGVGGEDRARGRSSKLLAGHWGGAVRNRS